MKIGGFQRFSMIDYPDKIAAVIFTQGCDFRCSFCHNPELVLPAQYAEGIDQKTILDFLAFRKDQLEGVVITGGEPTIHEDLSFFIRKIKDLDYDIKLDTNGAHPDIISELIDEQLVDYIAMDIKAPLARYNEIVNVEIKPELISASIALIQASGIAHEFRTTVVGHLFSEEDIKKMHKLVNFSDHYNLQKFRSKDKLLDQRLFGEKFTISEQTIESYRRCLFAEKESPYAHKK